MSLAESLRSDDVPRQLQALQVLVEEVRSLDDTTLTAVIENGLSCEKSSAVRELSFLCIERLYASHAARRWGEVRSAIVTELGTAEEPHALAAAIRVLSTLPLEEQMIFCTSKDGASVIRSVCLIEVNSVRAAAVEHLGPLLVHVWCYLHVVPNAIESVYQAESTSQARRMKEEVWDMIGDLFKSFAGGVLGVAAGAEPSSTLEDTPRCALAYCQVVAQVYELYYRSRCGDVLYRYCNALLGQSPPPLSIISRLDEINATHDCITPALSLLLQQITPMLCKEPQLLFLRCRQLGFAVACCSLVSFLWLSILAGAPSTAATAHIELRHEISTAMSFDAPVTADDTSMSRSADQSINAIQMLDEWSTSHLPAALQLTTSPSEIIAITYCLLATTQHPALILGRYKVAQLLLEHIFRSLRSTPPTPVTAILFPMALLAARCLPRSSLAEHLSGLITLLPEHISDNVAISKLMSEISMMLICDMSHHAMIAAPQALHSFMTSHVISAMFTDAAKASSRMTPVRERLVTSLCRCVVRLLPGALAAACVGGNSHVGMTAAVAGSTLSSISNATTSSSSLESLVASALIIVRYARKCFNWSISGVAGEAAQLGLVEAVGVLAQLLTPTKNDKQLLCQHVSDSLRWAATAFVDVVTDLLLLLRQPRAIPSSNARMQLLTLFGQYLETIFGPASYLTADRGLEVLDLIQADLMLTDVEKRFNSALMTRTVTGLLGGWINMNPPHPFVYAPIQVKALSALEVIAQHNSKLAESVLDILLEFDEKCITDARIKKLVSPSIQQKLILAIRRVLFCCPSTVNISAKTKHLNLVIDETKAARQSYRRNSIDHAAFDPFSSTAASAMPQIQTQRQHRSNSVAAVSAQESFKSFQRRASLGFSITSMSSSEPAPNTTAAAVKDVLRQVCKPGYMEALDAEAEYGIFSEEILGMTKTGGSEDTSRHVASADVLALIDDVLSYHLHPFTTCTSNETSVNQCIRGVLSFPGDAAHWHTLSGSSDVMTVHGRFVFFANRSEVVYIVRVINSSGFKIPCFSLQLLVDCSEAVCCISGAAIAEGVDYFLPGAMAERRFVLTVSSLADIRLRLRILLPDMVADSVDMFAAAVHAATKPASGATNGDNPSATVSASAVTYTARLECGVVTLPLTSLILPYGCGALTSMCNLRTDCVAALVPTVVFQSLWDRLSTGSQVPVAGMIHNHSTSLADLIKQATKNNLTVDNYNILLSSRSSFDHCGSSLGRSIMSTQAWCFHSWFGDEIAIKISAAKVARQEDNSNRRKLYWSGTMEIRTGNSAVLQLLLNHVTLLLQYLTGGAMQVCSNNKSFLALPPATANTDVVAYCPYDDLLRQSNEIREETNHLRKQQRETLWQRLQGSEYPAGDVTMSASLL